MSGTGSIVQVTQETKLNADKQRWEITKLPNDSYRDGDVTNFFNRTTGSVAFDQGNSIPLADGRVLWVTQDAWYQSSLAPNGNQNLDFVQESLTHKYITNALGWAIQS